MTIKGLIARGLLSGAAFAALAGGASAAEWYPYPVESWDPPFDMASPRSKVDYVPLEKASKPWEICVSFPHMKDAYWLAVDYGVAKEAEDLGVKMQLVEAGGYTELNTQISQIEDCVAAGADVPSPARPTSRTPIKREVNTKFFWSIRGAPTCCARCAKKISPSATSRAPTCA